MSLSTALVTGMQFSVTEDIFPIAMAQQHPAKHRVHMLPPHVKARFRSSLSQRWGVPAALPGGGFVG